MLDQLEEMLADAQSRKHYYGKFRGTVVDNTDPLQRGRLSVLVPAVLGSESSWAMPCVPYAGADVGFYALPDVGTSVWVEFEAGDLSYPIWSGCFWNEGGIADADASPDIKFFKTKKFKLRIDDTTGEVVIENDSGSQIKLTASEIVIKSSTVKQEAAGGRKTELSSASFAVNDGSMEVQ
jgi:uncharacterized protein involved in type VI secretion and phage assembly